MFNRLRRVVKAFPLLVVIIFAILAARTLIFQPGYFNMHDDLQMMRQLEMEKCFIDTQIPCRWVPDMGFGYGFPLFNFYPPLPYLAGEVFRILGFSFVTTVKLNFALSIILSGVTMYLFSRKFFGRFGGVVSAIFYIWAPYHAVDVYVRGAMNESWALVWFPLIFLYSYKLVTEKEEKLRTNLICLTLSYFALFISHNLMVLIFTPFFLVWIMIHLSMEGKWRRVYHLIISGLWAVGLAAFFTLPAIAENKYTHVREQLQGYFDFTAHFVSLKQLLFSRFWGYGGSIWGPNDGMSFQIGYVLWVASLLVGIFIIFRVIREIKEIGDIGVKIKRNRLLLVTCYLLLVGWFAAFMTHTRSIFVYKLIPVLGYVQFPWRFLTITIFAFSFVAGLLPSLFHSKKSLLNLAYAPFRMVFTSLLILLLVIVSWNYFKPEHGRMGRLTDSEKFSGAAWELQQGGGIIDYLPLTVEMAPVSARMEPVEFIDATGEFSNIVEGTNWIKFNSNASEATIRINVFDFPGWKVFVDGQEVDKFIPKNDKLGRMWFNLAAGDHSIYAKFENTSIRRFSNLLSIFSWTLLLLSAVLQFNSWKKSRM